jgi:hypothetical protein
MVQHVEVSNDALHARKDANLSGEMWFHVSSRKQSI